MVEGGRAVPPVTRTEELSRLHERPAGRLFWARPAVAHRGVSDVEAIALAGIGADGPVEPTLAKRAPGEADRTFERSVSHHHVGPERLEQLALAHHTLTVRDQVRQQIEDLGLKRQLAAALEKAASVSARKGNEEMPDQVRWIRSYVVDEDDGRLGTVCIYQGVSVEAIREHARRVGMPADEITPVATTVIVRDDPKDASKAA